ncbi:hypothetical protein [Flavobacterium sp.]|uniref:hypothetical protein n=1 Tax=Flavobacterium sp. TaxID=239 RepID=UPI0039E548B2
MIESVSVKTLSGHYKIQWQFQDHKLNMDLTAVPQHELQSFDIIINFTQPIASIRNHDYSWIKNDANSILNEFSPKIIRLTNGQLVQANTLQGIWEIKPKKNKQLLWRFNTKKSAPLAVYSGEGNIKKIVQAYHQYDFSTMPALLFPVRQAVEFSRSENPFSAVVCFTDHCDYDTCENLVLQRNFFKDKGIKVTKGFFLNHYSKKQDNASFENDADELSLWRDQGHELAYHSLSQSLKRSKEESFSDFENFKPPFGDLPTWIDHGFQPYNFSSFRQYNFSPKAMESTLKDKNIQLLWNCIDCGTSAVGVINQMNASDFTLRRFAEGNRHLPLSGKIGVMIKNIMFHHYADETIILSYKMTAANFKQLVYQKKISRLIPFVFNFLRLCGPLLTVFLRWQTAKNKPFKMAEYTPILFRHRISEEEFWFFQTVEMIDFKKSLMRENIDKLIKENGLCIAHTYFAVLKNYHKGKMFSSATAIDETVSANFDYLGEKIASGQIWNPTLKQLAAFLSNFEKAVLDVDPGGKIVIANAAHLPYRFVD